MLSKVVEAKKKKCTKGRLIRLIKFTTRETRQLIKNCIQQPHNRGHPFLKEIKFENIKK